MDQSAPSLAQRRTNQAKADTLFGFGEGGNSSRIEAKWGFCKD